MCHFLGRFFFSFASVQWVMRSLKFTTTAQYKAMFLFADDLARLLCGWGGFKFPCWVSALGWFVIFLCVHVWFQLKLTISEREIRWKYIVLPMLNKLENSFISMSLGSAVSFLLWSKGLKFRRSPGVRFCLLLPREHLSRDICAVSLRKLSAVCDHQGFGQSLQSCLSIAPAPSSMEEQCYQLLMASLFLLACNQNMYWAPARRSFCFPLWFNGIGQGTSVVADSCSLAGDFGSAGQGASQGQENVFESPGTFEGLCWMAFS